jgi:hypothetical protein
MKKYLPILYHQKLLPLLLVSIQENNGVHVSMKLETNKDADHAGLSELLKLYQIDSVLQVMELLTTFFHLKIWYHVTSLIWDAMADG